MTTTLYPHRDPAHAQDPFYWAFFLAAIIRIGLRHLRAGEKEITEEMLEVALEDFKQARL